MTLSRTKGRVGKLRLTQRAALHAKQWVCQVGHTNCKFCLIDTWLAGYRAAKRSEKKKNKPHSKRRTKGAG